MWNYSVLRPREDLYWFPLTKEKMKATENEILDFCKQNLAAHAVPQSIEFVDELPRNPSGKILKRELRERYGKRKR